MNNQPTTTTPDPELTILLGKKQGEIPPVLEGENARGEVAGCPTGLTHPAQADSEEARRAGGAQRPDEVENEDLTGGNG